MRERRRQQIDEARSQNDLKSRAVHHRRGTVVAASPLEITLGGATTSYTNVKALDSASFSVGDQVSVLVWKGDMLVLGPFGGSLGWEDIDFEASFGAVSGSASYRRDGKVVRLRGWVNGLASASGQLIATLPAGYRPEQTSRFIALQAAGNQVRIDIATTGAMTYSHATGTGNWSLDQIHFIAA